jgi:L-ascorbate metabolism protein UlaG (beta-lactamase superfamily)
MGATLDWLGCATFRLTLGERVVYLDAYLDRVPSAKPIGLSVADVDHADWIVVGHAHFDHLFGAERIARQTGATIIGSYETVRIMAAQGIPDRQLIAVAGGETVRLWNDVTVKVFPSQHSCVWSHRAMADVDQVCLGDLGVTYQEQQARLQELFGWLASLGEEVLAHLQASAQGGRGDGGPLLYLFETPEGSLVYQDTSGCWTALLRDLHPDVAILAAAGRGNLDGEPIQGSLVDFVAREVELVRPRRVVLCHHDDWLPGFSRAIDVAPIRHALARSAPATELVEMGYLASIPIFADLPSLPQTRA